MKHVRHDDVVADGLDVERHVVERQALVHERIFGEGAIVVGLVLRWTHQMKSVVIDVYPALGEVRCLEVCPSLAKSTSQASVGRPVVGLNHRHGMSRRRRLSRSKTDARIPYGNRPINCGKQEFGRFARS